MLPELLRQALLPDPVIRVLARLRELGFSAYLVGGGVRDLLRGVAPKDFDVATSARPEQVQRAFPKVIATGIEHGTVTVLLGKAPIEVTTYRTEGAYLDGRRPAEVSFHTDIVEDLSRRDFTINAMAFDPVKGELVDPFHGQVDLASGTVRCVGEALARFTEDGLRPLRAVRFCAVLGFSLDPATEAAIPPTVAVFRKVARERVREELASILLSPRAEAGLRLLISTGLLEACLPEVTALSAIARSQTFHALQHTPATLELRLCALLHAVGPSLKSALERLSLPSRTSEQVIHLLQHPPPARIDQGPDGGLRRWMAAVEEPSIGAALSLAEAVGSAPPGLRSRVTQLLSQNPPLTPRALALNGQAVMKVLGIAPSIRVGQATRFLMEKVLDDPTLNTPERLTALLLAWHVSPGP